MLRKRLVISHLIMNLKSGGKDDTSEAIVQVGHGDNDPLHDLYEIENHLTSQSGNRIILGSNENKTCRFCLKGVSQTSFRKKAHVIPEFMGNKKYFSNFECDSCNELFSKYENSLSNYGGILNVFSKLKGKKGYQKHKGSIESTETFVENDNIQMRINDPSLDQLKSISIDKLKKRIEIKTNKYSYIPLFAFKTLAKIGFSMMDESSIRYYEQTRKWLIENGELSLAQNNPIYHVYQKIGGRMFPHPQAFLLKKRTIFKDHPCPSHALIIFYGLFGFQLFIPGNSNDIWIWKGNKVILPIENHISIHKIDENQNVKISVDKVDFSSDKTLKTPSHNFSVGMIDE